MADEKALLRLLQLASPALPVGAFSYSEGLEYAVHTRWVSDEATLKDWLEQGLIFGSARLEAAVMLRVYDAWVAGDFSRVRRWDDWLGAARESEELRLQSQDMGRALLRLLKNLSPPPADLQQLNGREINFASAFGISAAHWAIPRRTAALGYLQSWAANLLTAGVKLIPLGQTAGQRLLGDLGGHIERAAEAAATLGDDELAVGNWGMALASQAHETQYTRLFRS